MELSKELFEQLVGTPVPAAPVKSDAVLPAGCRRPIDRRAATRQSFGKRAKICPTRGANAGFWQTVLVQDISVSGIGLIVEEALSGGESFLLQIQDTKDELVQITCTVKRCEPGGFGGVSFVVGAGFVEVSTDAKASVNAGAVKFNAAAVQSAGSAEGDANESGLSAQPILSRLASGMKSATSRTVDSMKFWRVQDDFSTPKNG